MGAGRQREAAGPRQREGAVVVGRWGGGRVLGSTGGHAGWVVGFGGEREHSLPWVWVGIEECTAIRTSYLDNKKIESSISGYNAG